jgi:Protein of unknown function (DUF2752)
VTVLAGAVAVLVAGLLVGVNADGAIFLRGLPTYPLPVVCPLRRYFGVPCPTCGVTRSMVHLIQGHPVESYAAHRLGWLILATVVMQIPYRAWCLTSGRRMTIPTHCAKFVIAAVFLLLVLNWLIP